MSSAHAWNTHTECQHHQQSAVDHQQSCNLLYSKSYSRISKSIFPFSAILSVSYCFRGAHGGWESRGALRTHAGGLILGLPGIVPSFSTFHVENHPVHVEEMSTCFSQCHRDVRQHLNVAVNLFISLDYLHCFLLPQDRVRRAPSLFPGGAQALTQPST